LNARQEGAASFGYAKPSKKCGKNPEDSLKQIGVPPFNAGRENLPVKSGASKLRRLDFES
jgi:hypothetical protein